MKHQHNYIINDKKLVSNEKKITIVVALTFITMIFEIVYGYITGSMALLADGWHMGSHVGALGIAVIVYKLARSEKLNRIFSFGTGKLVPLGGYTSALMLGIIALFMIAESIERFFAPEVIHFQTAITVSVIGFVVNLLSALILMDHHDHDHGTTFTPVQATTHHHHQCNHDHGHDHVHEHKHEQDHNHKSALVHVIADAFTSVLAIVALLMGRYFQANWADPLMGIVGGLVILKWAYGLSKATVWELLDGPSKDISSDDIQKLFPEERSLEILDLHVWRIAPNAHACELVVSNQNLKGSDFYRPRIQEKFSIAHLVIEERKCT
ncbi:MAG: CDF family Co(II)/Ni(II) efflux transporter DmeF [Bacteriovoracaceae bacterium]|nr:CDF family Co(II)/Ni(II) efflux transporter DmeF [Bacteriovoracaceae bacterium]